jgi:hypothetical protein
MPTMVKRPGSFGCAAGLISNDSFGCTPITANDLLCTIIALLNQYAQRQAQVIELSPICC